MEPNLWLVCCTSVISPKMLCIDVVSFSENGWVYSFRNFILAEIFGHNEERIKLCLLLFTFVSFDSKAEGYS